MFYVIIKYNPLQSSATVAGSRVSRNFRSNNPLAFRLRLYLLAFICTKLFSVINRVQNIADNDNPIFALYLLQALFEPFTGFVRSVPQYHLQKKYILTLYPLNNQANALVYGANRMVIKEYKRKWEEYKRIQAENSSGSYEPKKIAATSASSTSTTTKNDIEMNMDMTPSPLSNSNTEVVPVSATKKKKHPKMLTKSMQSMEFVARDFSTGAVSGDTPTTTTATTNKSGGDDDEGEDSSA